MRHFRPFLAHHQLTEQQWRVLRVLAEEGPLDFGQVAKKACLLRPSLTRISKSLIDEGLVSAEAHPNDKRRSLLNISSDGLSRIENMTPQSRSISEALEKRIGEKEFQSLLQQLDDVLNKLEES